MEVQLTTTTNKVYTFYIMQQGRHWIRYNGGKECQLYKYQDMEYPLLAPHCDINNYDELLSYLDSCEND